jgi:LytS/YehU family sensor histidine kinase
MLFNTLANLRSLVDDEPAQAKHMIDLLITYLRGALAGSRANTTTLQAEFAQLAAYLEVMALRLGKRLRWQLELPEDLQQAAVPSMLLQPLVENALKHGIEPKIGGGTVSVRARRSLAGLEVQVGDTGLGLPPDHPREPDDRGHSGHGGSYGLMHVRERLRTLYGCQASLQIERQEPAGTLATVRIPA